MLLAANLRDIHIVRGSVRRSSVELLGLRAQELKFDLRGFKMLEIFKIAVGFGIYSDDRLMRIGL